MRRSLVLLGVLGSGCGRFEFAALPDAAPDPLAHDEDGDGIPDLTDPCPHVAGDATDLDSDGVEDACDPNPATGTERFLVFSTLGPGDHPFDSLGAFDQQADTLHVAGDTRMATTAAP